MYYHPFGNERGLSLRDYFASQIYQSGSDGVEQAKAAYRAADAMLTIREMTDAELNPPVVAPVITTDPVVTTTDTTTDTTSEPTA